MSVKDLRENNVDVNRQRWLQANRTVIAASSAAVTSVLAGFPFDSIKTRMQTRYYTSILDCVKATYAEEGTRGFFRGMIPPLVTVSIIKSVSFSIYEGTKKHLLSNGFRFDNLNSVTQVAAIGGGASGAFVSILCCPLELVKIQRQLEQMILKSEIESGRVSASEAALNQSSTSWHAVKQIVKRKGVFGLWSGLGCHLARDVLGTSIYFGGYESMKYILSRQRQDGSPIVHFMSGGFCGILSWLFVFPVDAIKTNLQKDIMIPKPKYAGVLDYTRRLVKKNGIKGLYRGLNVTLLRAFPIHSLNFLVYEQVLKSIPPLPSTVRH